MSRPLIVRKLVCARVGTAKLTVETEVLEDLDCAARKLGTTLGCRCGLRKVGGVGPAANRQQDLQLAVALFQEVELLCAAVDIGASVIPGVGRVVLVGVGPGVGKIDLARLRSHVGKGVEHMSKLLGGKILGIEVASVDSLSHC